MPPRECTEPQEVRRRWLPPLVLMLVCGMLGVGVLSTLHGAAADSPLGGDGLSYHRLALGLLDGHGFSLAEVPPYLPTVARAPGYPAFLSLCYRLFGNSVWAVRVCQFGLLAATAVTLFLLLRLVVSERTAWVAALLCITYVPFVLMTTYHLSETLAFFLLTVALYFLASSCLHGERWRAWASGLAFGALALVRPALWLMPIAFLPLLWRRRPSSGPTLALLAASGWLALVVPWMVRNAMVSGLFVGMGTGGGWSFYVSIQQWKGDVSFAVRLSDWERIMADFAVRQQLAEGQTGSRWGTQTELVLDRNHWRDARAGLGTLDMLGVVERFPSRLAYLWSTGDSAPWPSGTRAQVLVHRFAQMQFAILFIAGAVNAWISRSSFSWFLLLLCLPAGYVSVLHMVFHVEARYSLPARVTLLFFPAQALCATLPHLGRAWKRLVSMR